MQSYSSNEVDHATESSHNPAFRQLLADDFDLSLWVYVDEQMDDQKIAAEHQRRISAAFAEAQEANGRLKVALQKIKSDKSILDRLCLDFTAVYLAELKQAPTRS